jgi:hypothetical protein
LACFLLLIGLRIVNSTFDYPDEYRVELIERG